MIGEGLQSTNQRRHNYVQENVEVGFFTDPTVCIGCKACEVACKEWNEVPEDGFTWSGNSYDNTGHLGASTWRHVLFLEQDQQKGQQIFSGPLALILRMTNFIPFAGLSFLLGALISRFAWISGGKSFRARS